MFMLALLVVVPYLPTLVGFAVRRIAAQRQLYRS
jgi:hypothetical protein